MRWYPVQLFLFQRGEKALHPGIVITFSRTIHSLFDAKFIQPVPESSAGILAAAVAVKYRTAQSITVRYGI